MNMEEALRYAKSRVSPTVIEQVLAQYRCDLGGYHGAAHWDRVLYNALTLFVRTEDKYKIHFNTLPYFALFHDSQRFDEGHDLSHGMRAATYIEKNFSATRLGLSRFEYKRLIDACFGHTTERISRDPTIAICWDADRLDLGRVGVIPDPSYFSTEEAKCHDLIRSCVNTNITDSQPLSWFSAHCTAEQA